MLRAAKSANFELKARISVGQTCTQIEASCNGRKANRSSRTSECQRSVLSAKIAESKKVTHEGPIHGVDCARFKP